MRATLDKMMSTDVCHDLRTRQDLGMKLLLDLVELLYGVLDDLLHDHDFVTYRFIIVHLHLVVTWSAEAERMSLGSVENSFWRTVAI